MFQRKCLQLVFSKYFTLFGALLIEKELLISNGRLVAETRPEQIPGDTSITQFVYKVPLWM